MARRNRHKLKETISTFDREYAFLSNFCPSPIIYAAREWSFFEHAHQEEGSFGEPKEWRTVEHAFQAQKTFIEAEQELIRSAPTPGKAKRLGRKISFFRPDWEEVKVDIMYDLLNLKFTQNKDLGRQLAETGDALLVEGNYWHDNIWGDCGCEKCRDIEGENLLGKLLMEVRRELITK